MPQDMTEPSAATGKAARVWSWFRRLVLNELVLFLASAVIVTWPLATRMTDALPQGTEEVATVPLFNLWTLWWNAEWWTFDGRGYWDAPIFAPQKQAFSLSEPQPTMMAVAPIVWCDGSPVLAYNVYLLLSLCLNGLASSQLLRGIGLSRGSAAAGGLFVQWLPYVQWQLGVLQLVPLFGEAWTILAVKRLVDSPSLWRGAVVGAAFGLSYLTCHHNGLFFAVLLVVSAPWMVGRSFLSFDFWKGVAAAAVVAGLMVAPSAVIQRRLFREQKFTRDRELIVSLALKPADYTVTFKSPVRLRDLSTDDRRRWWPLSPGWIKLALASVGLVLSLYRREWRGWGLCMLMLIASGFLLSLGPDARWKWLAPYEAIRSIVPGFEHVRNVHRFALFAQLGIAWLAACGIEAMTAPRRTGTSSVEPSGGMRRRLLSGLCLLILALAGSCESWPRPQLLVDLSAPDLSQGWIKFLRDETPPDSLVVCLPFPETSDVGAYESETRWMSAQMYHRRALLNGYSGYFPESYLEGQDIGWQVPEESALRQLVDRGVGVIVLDRTRLRDQGPVVGSKSGPVMTRIYRDAYKLRDIYRLEPGPLRPN